MASPRLVVMRVDQGLEAAHLDGAGDLDLVAQRARQIDIEAGRIAVGAGEVERRIIGLGQEADHGDARQVRPVRPPPRVPEAGHRLRRGLGRGSGDGLALRRRRADAPASAAATDQPASRARTVRVGVRVTEAVLGHCRRFRGIRRPYRPSGRRGEGV